MFLYTLCLYSVTYFRQNPEALICSETIWAAPDFYSLHFDRDSDLRDAIPGIGFQWDVKPQWSLAIGHFKNSNSEQSNYLGALYMPVDLGSWRAGLALVAFDGCSA
jgi:hypothetical protein